MAVLLAAGGVAGAPIGAHLLHRFNEAAVRWVFVVFLAAVMISLIFIVPDRGAEVPIDIWLGIALVALGFVTGILPA